MDIAIMGYGVVGSGVALLLQKNYESIVARSMQSSLNLKYILDLLDFPGDPFESLIIHDFETILRDENIGIVVETMGGLNPAYDFVRRCLLAGKSVVTSNKELVATKGYDLLCVAKEHNVNFLFEASVGGGIPIIRPLTQCLAANEITEVAGILNGTTNFILTRMIENAMPFDHALRLAQNNGYAETDPTADIDGHDACRKICILAALSFGQHVYPEQVRTQGIAALTTDDVEAAGDFGYAVKLLGRAKRLPNGRISCSVAPTLVPRESMLANVRDVYNAILVRGNAIDDVIFYGRGAGKLPTASAVVADIIDCAKHTTRRRFFGWEAGGTHFVADADDDAVNMFVRAIADDTDQARQQLVGLFPTMEEKKTASGSLCFMTGVATPRLVKQALASIDGLQVTQMLRVL
ncbi:MAG: homoserine dehydrogenase [Oscillospiraceae bacterium]|nr:homoserine dehydrogenase [Oscillospiraceae bacterium]